MKCFVAVLGILIGGISLWGDEWELVYPEEYPVAEELPFLSIGKNGDAYMIGSHAGYVLTDAWDRFHLAPNTPPFTNRRGNLHKLPIPFDVTAISSVGISWILGGNQGQYAIHDSPDDYLPWLLDTEAALLDHWKIGHLDTSKTIVKFAVIDDRILALVVDEVNFAWYHRGEYELYSSIDRGDTWTQISPMDRIFDVVEFKGDFHVIGKSLNQDPETLVLLRTKDFESWSIVWEVLVDNKSPEKGQMMVLGDTSLYWGVQGNELPPHGKRLFVRSEFVSTSTPSLGTHKLSVSTSDGETWLDNGSVSTSGGPTVSYYDTQWNPLSLPLGLLYGHRPEWSNTRQNSGNFRIVSDQIEVYHKQDWIKGVSSTEGDLLYPETACLWTDLSFIRGLSGITTVTGNGLEVHPTPVFNTEIYSWEQLICAGGDYFAVAGKSQQTIPPSRLAISSDLDNWQEIPLPEGAVSIRLIPTGNTVAAFYTSFTLEKNGTKALSFWDNGWSDPVLLSYWVLDVAYVPKTGRFYTLQTPNEQDSTADPESKVVLVEQLDEDGSLVPFASFLPEVWNGYFERLTCPDGENLIVYGDSAEIAVIKPDGAVHHSHPWKYFPPSEYRIDSVKFVNGWYYLLGDVAIRTRDFVNYEVVSLPFDQPLTNVIGFGDNLYGFVSGAAYQQPMEKGYLDSIIRDQGWRQSDWLGWFKVIIEQEGQIYHLLLGTTKVTEITEGQYWLDTATLGKLFARTDWMPWVQRESDGRWFWLDQDSWPPRAWDSETEEWEALEP